MTSLLWLEEDELRAMCIALLGQLATAKDVMDEVYAYGYKQGFATGLAQLTHSSEKRDAEGIVLH